MSPAAATGPDVRTGGRLVPDRDVDVVGVLGAGELVRVARVGVLLWTAGGGVRAGTTDADETPGSDGPVGLSAAPVAHPASRQAAIMPDKAISPDGSARTRPP